MKLRNAVKKLEKLGLTVQKNGGVFRAHLNGDIIGFCANGRVEDNNDIGAIHTVSEELAEEQDSMSDYHPETFHDNLTQALKFIGAV